MNSLDIIPPDFKLTGTVIKDVQITKQRKLVSVDFVVDTTLPKLTAYAQSNIIPDDRSTFLAFIEAVPPAQSELFTVALGKKAYLDEVCLCLYLNTATPETRSDSITILYKKLLDIIKKVMELTTGSKGSRRHIYQHYFYSQSEPKEKDGILMGMTGVNLTTISRDNVNSIKQFRKELVGLYATEDIPVLDLVDLTLDQFNIILKLLPKDNAWLRSRKERSKFFESVSNDLDKLADITEKFNSLSEKYDTLTKKHAKNSISLEELMSLYELKKKDIMNTVPQKIESLINMLNAFILMYNANAILKYKGKTLPQASSLINDLLNSQFMTFLQTFKSQYKSKLGASVQGKLLSKEADPSQGASGSGTQASGGTSGSTTQDINMEAQASGSGTQAPDIVMEKRKKDNEPIIRDAYIETRQFYNTKLAANRALSMELTNARYALVNAIEDNQKPPPEVLARFRTVQRTVFGTGFHNKTGLFGELFSIYSEGAFNPKSRCPLLMTLSMLSYILDYEDTKVFRDNLTIGDCPS
jgi:hypothetical protein